MSLTRTDIESILADGVYFSKGDREFAARATPGTDRVAVTEMTALNRDALSLEFVIARARADHTGSELADVAALRKLLGELV
jgi:hypothetical protein